MTESMPLTVPDEKTATFSEKNPSLLQALRTSFDKEYFKKINWAGTFDAYLDIVSKNPRIISNAWTRMYNMISSKGFEEITLFKKKVRKYKFFSDHKDYPIFGLEDALSELVDIIHAGSLGYGPEKRVLILHGPVGSSKSTICTLLKRGLEEYSRKDEGSLYTYYWNLEGTDLEEEEGKTAHCPINEEPLNILPLEGRRGIIEKLISMLPEAERFDPQIEWSLCPKCQFYFDYFIKKYDGDIEKVLSHIVVQRFIFDEKTRKGIGTFQPKDEKNQDSTELTGDINFRKLGKIGVDSDPRCFNFDGEFQVANRGMCEFIEVLKLTKEFLYDLLGASQEKQIKPKKFSQMHIDEMLIGHTNAPEMEKLQQDRTMEALRDRTIKVNIPYLVRWDDEIKIYKHSYNFRAVKQHIAPHTLEIAALWAIATRLHEPKDQSVDLVQKAKLYNGQFMSGWTEDKVKELRDNSAEEGMSGISARFIQNAISNILVVHKTCINTFMLLKEIRTKLSSSSLLNNEDDRKRYMDLLSLVTKEYDEIIKNEVQRALIGDENAIQRLCTAYIDNVVAFINNQKIENPITGREEIPNERLMRSIEEKVGVTEQNVNEFRRAIMMHMGTLSQKNITFDYKSNVKLTEALQKKLFEDTKDTIKLSKLSRGATVVDKDIQEKLDAIKTRLVKQYGYCDHCAVDIMDYASSIFARGDLIEAQN